MGSRKKSARQAQRAAFETSLQAGSRDLDPAFAREGDRREAGLRYKACERKKRYATRADAEDAARSCQRHGSRDLHVYHCPHCDGWHLTHKPVDGRRASQGR